MTEGPWVREAFDLAERIIDLQNHPMSVLELLPMVGVKPTVTEDGECAHASVCETPGIEEKPSGALKLHPDGSGVCNGCGEYMVQKDGAWHTASGYVRQSMEMFDAETKAKCPDIGLMEDLLKLCPNYDEAQTIVDLCLREMGYSIGRPA